MKDTLRWIIGDIHGAGDELEGLLTKSLLFAPNEYSPGGFSCSVSLGPEKGDEIWAVGDLFDRGYGAYKVWKLLKDWNIKTLQGNHELNFLKFLKGKRDDLPVHYYWALNTLRQNGVTLDEFVAFLEAQPTIKIYEDLIIAHAGVNPHWPEDPSVDYTVYGRSRSGDGGVVYHWWDEYKQDRLVVYGHLSQDDMRPRIRRGLSGEVNSIGLDTACIHSGPLTAFCPEEKVFIQYRSGKDWFSDLKAEMKGKVEQIKAEATKGLSVCKSSQPD
jgi:hypothetical protein